MGKAFATNTIDKMPIEDMYNVDAGALLSRTLHSKPTTASSMNPNNRQNKNGRFRL